MADNAHVPIPKDGWEPATRQQELMRIAVAELMAVHSLTERIAASLMLTVTSVVRLAPKQQ